MKQRDCENTLRYPLQLNLCDLINVNSSLQMNDTIRIHLSALLSMVLLICARERLVSAHLSRFSGKDGNHLQGCCSQQYEEGDILGCSCLRRVKTGA